MGSALVTDQETSSPQPRRRPRINPLKLGAYLAAVVLWVVATIFFGRYGFFLGLAIVVLVRVAFWAVPLVRLSYATDHHEPQAPRQ